MAQTTRQRVIDGHGDNNRLYPVKLEKQLFERLRNRQRIGDDSQAGHGPPQILAEIS
jgi:hypothetical protein